jgi:hypothetical protein
VSARFDVAMNPGADAASGGEERCEMPGWWCRRRGGVMRCDAM